MPRQPRTYLILLLFVTLLLACQDGTAPLPPTPTPPAPPTASPPPANAVYLDILETVWSTVNERYFDPTFGGVDWQAVHDRYRPLVAAAEDDYEFYLLVNQMLRELRVSHLFLIPPEATEYLESADTCAGSAGLDVRMVGQQLLVVAVRPGYPAEAAGLQPGDVILTVEGLPVERGDELMLFRLPAASEEERLAGALATVRGFFYGQPGTTVTLTYLDAQDQVHEARLLRRQRTERLAESPEGLPPFYVEVETRQLEGGIGYIRFSAFHTGVFQEVLEAIDSMQGTPGLILDLRGNPGGFYPVRKGIAQKFFQERVLFWSYRTRPGLDPPGFEHEAYLEPAEKAYTGTLVVLVDGLSASSSEEFSGAMQASGRATIVGQRTAGKVLVADVVSLPNGALFLYPLAQTVLSDGTVLEGRGVIPDVEVALDRALLLEGIDAPLEAAVAYIEAVSGRGVPQFVRNGSFDTDTRPWEERIGRLRYSGAFYLTAPGAAQVTTTKEQGLAEYRAVFGQCVDLGSALEKWPVSGAGRLLTLAYHVRTAADIAQVGLTALFFDQAGCRGTQLDALGPTAVPGNRGWTRAAATGAIPEAARSVDVFITAVGTTGSATVYVDDVQVYPGIPDSGP